MPPSRRLVQLSIRRNIVNRKPHLSATNCSVFFVSARKNMSMLSQTNDQNIIKHHRGAQKGPAIGVASKNLTLLKELKTYTKPITCFL